MAQNLILEYFYGFVGNSLSGTLAPGETKSAYISRRKSGFL
jgi:hypothetical protein